MADSKALARQKKHTRTGGVRRNEGIWLSLDQMDGLVSYLRTNSVPTSQGINAVAFMIGKAGSSEFTVEVFPCTLNSLTTPTSGTFMVDAAGLSGGLLIPGLPFDNQGGGSGGNQKTPPPS